MEAYSSVGRSSGYTVDVESVQSWDSNASVSTSEADIPVTVEPNMTWCTPEDKEEQEAAILAKALRPHPLVPPQLPGWEANLSQPKTLTAVRCAFEGCAWCADTEPCRPGQWQHTWRLESTKWVFAAQTHPAAFGHTLSTLMPNRSKASSRTKSQRGTLLLCCNARTKPCRVLDGASIAGPFAGCNKHGPRQTAGH